MGGSFPKDPTRLLVLTSGSRPVYPLIALIDGTSFNRQWTIGNLGDDYGYSELGLYGDLVSNEWFNYVDNVALLVVDISSNAVILRSNISSMWGMANSVTLSVEGFGNIVLTWNGATIYTVVGNTAFVNYVVSQLGNSIGIRITPENPIPPTSNNIITTLLEPEITTLGDNITHTGT